MSDKGPFVITVENDNEIDEVPDIEGASQVFCNKIMRLFDDWIKLTGVPPEGYAEHRADIENLLGEVYDDMDTIYGIENLPFKGATIDPTEEIDDDEEEIDDATEREQMMSSRLNVDSNNNSNKNRRPAYSRFRLRYVGEKKVYSGKIK